MFNPGVSTQTVTLTTLPDALPEGDEDLNATITADSSIVVFAPEASVTVTESSTFQCVCIYVHLYIISNIQ